MIINVARVSLICIKTLFIPAQRTSTCKTDGNSGADREGSRAPHVPAHLPPGEKADTPAPSIHVHYDLQATFDVGDESSASCGSPDGVHGLVAQNDVEPDSLSDASKSEDGSLAEDGRRTLSDTEDVKQEGKPRLPAKSTSFYIGSDEAASKTDHGGVKTSLPKTEKKHGTKTFSTATLTKPRSSHDGAKVRPNVSAPVLCQGSESREGPAPVLLRQKSFTKEKSSNVKLPSITSLSAQRDSGPESVQGPCKDTRSYLKETEDVLAVLEAKLQAAQTEAAPVADSLSGDSDVDTSSTVSQRSNRPRSNTLTKKAPASGFHRERSSGSLTSQDSAQLPGAADGPPSQGGESSKNRSESAWRHAGLKRSVGKYGSTDLSDDPQSLPHSDQENNTHSSSRKYTVPLQKEDGKGSKASQVLSRTKSLSAPRPTRASMLRRARLGEASDNEGPETEKPEEAGNAPSRQAQETKKLSRLDVLAMPRKRTSSFNTPSDTEPPSSQWTGRSAGFSNRSTESAGSSARRASTPGPKPVERPQKPPLNRTPITRIRSSSAKYASSTASEYDAFDTFVFDVSL